MFLDSFRMPRYHASSMAVLIFIKNWLLATLGQMASLFAVVFIFGLLLNIVSQITFKSLEKAFGHRGVYVVAWLGTPVHELGHALFCFPFFHRIEEIHLFRPDPVTGNLGFVYHTWNRKNPWAVLGNFFIGIGPVILGSAVLFGLFYWLVPGSHQAWDAISASVSAAGDFTSWRDYTAVFGESSLVLVRTLFTSDNLLSWQFWVFLYLAICVASNIRLSVSDIRGALSGAGWLVVPFLIINLIGLLTEAGTAAIFPVTASTLGIAAAILILASILALVGFIIVYLIASLFYRWHYHRWLNPFSR